jgi:hypothetical protein
MLGLIIRLPSPGFVRRVGQPSEVPVYLRICCCKRGQAVPAGATPAAERDRQGSYNQGSVSALYSEDDARSSAMGCGLQQFELLNNHNRRHESRPAAPPPPEPATRDQQTTKKHAERLLKRTLETRVPTILGATAPWPTFPAEARRSWPSRPGRGTSH